MQKKYRLCDKIKEEYIYFTLEDVISGSIPTKYTDDWEEFMYYCDEANKPVYENDIVSVWGVNCVVRKKPYFDYDNKVNDAIFSSPDIHIIGNINENKNLLDTD